MTKIKKNDIAGSRGLGYMPPVLNNAYVKFTEVIANCVEREKNVDPARWLNKLFPVKKGEKLRFASLIK